MPLASVHREWLQTRPDAEVDHCLAAALPGAGAGSGALVDLILRRQQHEGLIQLIEHWDQLPVPERERLSDVSVGLAAQMLAAVRSSRGRAGRNALAITAQRRDARQAHLLAEALRVGDVPLRTEAARQLLDLVQGMVTALVKGPAPATPAVDRGERLDYLLAALSDALASFDAHRQPAVLLAALSATGQWSVQAFHGALRRTERAVTGLSILLKQPEHAAAGRSLLSMGMIEPLRPAVREGLAWVGQNPAALGDVLRQAALLALPMARAALASLPDADRLLPGAEALRAMRPVRARSLPRWIDALHTPDAPAVAALGRLAEHEDAATRLLALRSLIRRTQAGQEGAARELLRFCDDAQAVIARMALRHLVWARWPQLTQHLPSLVTSPHPEVRAVAGRALGPRAFELFWTNWPRLPAERRRAAGKALVKVAPQFGELLKARLTTQGLTDRMQGLAVVRELELGPDFAPEIMGLAGGSDPVIASAAVGALASRSDPQAAERIAAHLDHADPRVRANAVEALDRMDDRGHLDRLTRMAQEEANRPRANAIRALIRARRTREALPALHEMLHHPLPQHRASALWVVQNLGLVELVRAVAELALTDPDAGVQGRAMDLVKQLAKQTQAKRATSIAGLDPAELAHAVAEGGG